MSQNDNEFPVEDAKISEKQDEFEKN